MRVANAEGAEGEDCAFLAGGAAGEEEEEAGVTAAAVCAGAFNPEPPFLTAANASSDPHTAHASDPLAFSKVQALQVGSLSAAAAAADDRRPDAEHWSMCAFIRQEETLVPHIGQVTRDADADEDEGEGPGFLRCISAVNALSPWGFFRFDMGCRCWRGREGVGRGGWSRRSGADGRKSVR